MDKIYPPKPHGAEMAELAARWQIADHAGKLQICSDLGRQYQTVKGWICEFNPGGVVPRSLKALYNKPPHIKGDVLVLFDCQVPFHDGSFIDKCLELAESWSIKKGIVGGDFFNMTAFSHFSHKPEDTWREEAEVSRQVLAAMASKVDEWLLLAGNHDMFLIKAVSEQFDMEDILKLVGVSGAITASSYYYCIVNDTWRVSHPRNISTIHGRVSGRLATKHKMNVASGHGHLFGISLSEDGGSVGIDVGVCCEPDRLDYAATRDTLRPAMNKGALIIKKGDDGHYHYYSLRPDSDWAALKRLYGQTEDI